MSLIKRLIFIASCAFLSSACGGSHKPSAGEVPVPYLDFECNSSQSYVCSPIGHGQYAYVGLSSDLNFNCETELAGLSANLFLAQFDYAGRTLSTWNGLVLTGVITSWYNSSDAKMLTMRSGTYKVCAFIDNNNNGSLDINEPLAEETIDPSQDFLPVSNWIQI